MKTTKKILIILIAIISMNVVLVYNRVLADTTINDYFGDLDPPLERESSVGRTIEIAPSVLTNNQNVYCRESGFSSWYGQVEYKVNYFSEVTDNKTAYILAQNKFSSVTKNAEYNETKQHNSVSQNAYWFVLGQDTKSYTTAVENLINKAEEYAGYRDNFKDLQQLETTPTDYIVNGKTIIGPYKIEYSKSTNFGNITSISLTGKIGNGSETTLSKGTDYYLSSESDGSDEINVPSSQEQFYIVIKNANVTEVGDLTIEQAQLKYTVYQYELERVGTEGQNLTVVEKEKDEASLKIDIVINKIVSHPFDFVLNKTDFSGNKLQGVTFTVYFNNIKSLKINGTEVKTNTEKIGQSLGNGITYSTKTSATDADTNNISIYGLKTGSDGNINITDIISTTYRFN